MKKAWRKKRLLLLICTAGLGCASPAGAQVSAYGAAKQVHWASAAFFGTGWYSVAENREAFIFRLPPRQTLRTAGWDDEGQRILGIEIHYPVTLGLHRLDDLPDFLEFENYGTLSFTPGIEIEVPVTPRWHLRPYAHAGFGYENTSNEWAGVWYGGLKSRYVMEQGEEFSWNLLGELSFAGYRPQYKERGQYGQVMAGLEFSHRLGAPGASNDPWHLDWHFTYSWMFDKLNFHVTPEEVVSVRDQWELGLALGKGRKKVKIAFFELEHVGLSFRFSSNGNYQAVTLNLRSPFTL